MKKTYIGRIALILVFLIGLTIFVYPVLSDYIARRNVITGANKYNQLVVDLSASEIEKMWEMARLYNDSLNGAPVTDPFVAGRGNILPANYLSVLDTGDGIMGYVDIEKINAYLPIYHGVSDEVLEKGAGHMPQTPLPIGGLGNLSVLTAHTGQTTAEMFDRLTEMVEGDIFVIRILDEIFTYEVDNIKIILPHETESLIPEAKKDLVTLITCTPYGVNSHRLLVRGSRIANRPEVLPSVEQVAFPWRLIMMVCATTIPFAFVFIRNLRSDQKASKV